MFTPYFKQAMSSFKSMVINKGILTEEKAEEMMLKAYWYAMGHRDSYTPAIIAIIRSYDMPSCKEFVAREGARDGNDGFCASLLHERPSFVEIGAMVDEFKRFLAARDDDALKYGRSVITL